MQLLDIDRDGVFSSSELKEAAQKILKRYPTALEAEVLVKLLDTDNDGKGEYNISLWFIKESMSIYCK